MRPAGFGLDAQRFPIVPGHHQVTQKLVGVRKVGVGVQRRLELPL